MRGRREFHDWIVIILMLAVVTFLLFEFVVFFVVPNQKSQMSAYGSDPLWNDITLFAEDLEDEGNYDVRCVTFSPSVLDTVENPEETLFIMIGPEREYTGAEAGVISRFVERGGSIILADDSGRANSLSEKAPRDSPLRDSSRYSGDILLSLDCEKNPRLVKTTARFGGSRYELLLNEPTALTGPEDQSLAESSVNSWMDVNGNEEYDPEEPYGEKFDNYLLIRHIPLGKMNFALFIADSSLFINDMWGRADNSRFVLDYIGKVLPENGTVIIDQSTHRDGTVLGRTMGFTAGTAGYLCNSIPFMVISGAVVTLLGIILFMQSKKVRRRPHMIQPTTPVLLELKDTDITNADMVRLRSVIYDLLCIEYGLDYAYFWQNPQYLQILIRDYPLYNFMRYPHNFGYESLGEMLERCGSRWVEGEEFVRNDLSLLDEYLKYGGGISATGEFTLEDGDGTGQGHGMEQGYRSGDSEPGGDGYGDAFSLYGSDLHPFFPPTVSPGGAVFHSSPERMNHPQMNLWVSSSVLADRTAPLHLSEASFLKTKQESASPSPPPPDGGGPRRGFLRMDGYPDGPGGSGISNKPPVHYAVHDEEGSPAFTDPPWYGAEAWDPQDRPLDNGFTTEGMERETNSGGVADGPVSARDPPDTPDTPDTLDTQGTTDTPEDGSTPPEPGIRRDDLVEDLFPGLGRYRTGVE